MRLTFSLLLRASCVPALSLLLCALAVRDLSGQAFDCVILPDNNTNIFVTPQDCFDLPENQIWCDCVRSLFVNPVKGQKSGFNQAVEWILDQPGIGNHRVEVPAGTLDPSTIQVGEVIGSTLTNELCPVSACGAPGLFFKVRSEVRVTAVNGNLISFDIVVVEASPTAEAILRYKPTGPKDTCHYNGLFYQGTIASHGPGSGFTIEYRYPEDKILPPDGTCSEGQHPAIEEDDAGGPGFTVRFLFQFFNTPASMAYTLPTANTVDVTTTLRRFTDTSLEEILPLGESDLCQIREVLEGEPAADPTPCKILSETLQLENAVQENGPPTARIAMTDPFNASLIPDGDTRFKTCGEARVIFRGSTSDDGDGGIQPLSYEWFIVSGPAGGAVIPDATKNFMDTEISFLAPGEYEIGLSVDDGGAVNNTSETTATLFIQEDPVGNIAPTAEIRTVPDPAEVELVNGKAPVTLDGSKSSNGAPGIDDCAQVLSFKWTQLDGPPGKTATIVSPTADVTEVQFDFPGDYTFELEVNDGATVDDTATAEATVTVTGAPAQTSFRRGDSDGNAELQLTDAVRILNVLFLGAGVINCQDAADADDNGALQLTDAVRILNVLFLGTGTIPAPGPQSCGDDTTLDALADCVYDPAKC